MRKIITLLLAVAMLAGVVMLSVACGKDPAGPTTTDPGKVTTDKPDVPAAKAQQQSLRVRRRPTPPVRRQPTPPVRRQPTPQAAQPAAKIRQNGTARQSSPARKTLTSAAGRSLLHRATRTTATRFTPKRSKQTSSFLKAKCSMRL